MTTLTGTDKQIVFAQDIRTDTIKQVDKFKAALTAAAVRKPGQDQLLAVALDAIDNALSSMVAEQTTAIWWIDHQWDTTTIIKRAGSAAAHAAG